MVVLVFFKVLLKLLAVIDRRTWCRNVGDGWMGSFYEYFWAINNTSVSCNNAMDCRATLYVNVHAITVM